MQKKYQINLSSLEVDLSCFNTSTYSDQCISYAKKNDKVKSEIKQYIDENNKLDAEKIMSMMFPKYTSHLFISHKSEHANTAIKLANILYEKYRIISFIDSQVWHHIDMVKQMINDKVSKVKEDGGIKTYNHTRANIVASNVFAMLSASLFKVMDEADGFIYIDSQEPFDNSHHDINKTDIDSLKTKSPWLFLETTYAGMLRKKMHKRPTLTEAKQYVIKAHIGQEARSDEKDIEFEYTASIIDAVNISSIGSALHIENTSGHPLLCLDQIYAELDKNNKEPRYITDLRR